MALSDLVLECFKLVTGGLCGIWLLFGVLGGCADLVVAADLVGFWFPGDILLWGWYNMVSSLDCGVQARLVGFGVCCFC